MPVAIINNKGKKLELSPGQEAVFMVFGTGEKVDLRKLPPFHQLLPCPFCGVKEDHDHIALAHVDSRLGTPV